MPPYPMIQSLVLALLLTPLTALGATPTTNQDAAQTRPAPAQDDNFSEANQLLFLQDHLTGTPYSARYIYQNAKSGSADDFDSRITMTARNRADSDAKHVTFSQMDEHPGRQIDAIENARGNPLIMVFLQSDVLDLAAATGGHWRYFQKQMKLALENRARVEPVTLSFQGRSVEGRRITVKPYAGDPQRRQELGRYVDKIYQFTLSDRVPGTVVELRTRVPPDAKTDRPEEVERLTLQSIEKIDTEG